MRGFWVVLDSFGIGSAPDADRFGDSGASTIGTISKSKYFDVFLPEIPGTGKKSRG